MRRLLGHAGSAIVGAAVGAIAVLGFSGLASEPGRVGVGEDVERPRRVATGISYRVIEPPRRERPRLLLAWAPMGSGGLPAGTARVLEKMPAVADATMVTAGVWWLERAVSDDGTTLDAPGPGRAIPVEAAVVDPEEYARFVPPGERDTILSLSDGTAVIAETEARIRRGGIGTRLVFPEGTIEVSAVASDIATNGYEVLIGSDVPASWGSLYRFVLVHLTRHGERRAVVSQLRAMLGPGEVLRVRAKGETPFLRYGDAVLPDMLVKRVFGEFAAAPSADGTVDPDPRWLSRNIRVARVPLLGRVTCHRALLPQLRRALAEVAQRGLSFAVNASQYGGCFGPRFIGAEPGGRLSHHAWGIAIDINVAENAFGTRPDQDPRLVEIMEDHGFTWGGRWLIPDGMHFEWTRFP